MFKRLLKLHFTLIRHIFIEIRKKKTFNEIIQFLKTITKSYITVMQHEWKQFLLLFNKEHRKQLKEMEKQQIVKKDLKNALKLLEYIEKKLEKKGYTRFQVRQFMRDFQKNREIRKDIYKELLDELNAWRV